MVAEGGIVYTYGEERIGGELVNNGDGTVTYILPAKPPPENENEYIANVLMH